MELQHQRLSSLIQFVQESERLKCTPKYDVGDYPLCEYEHNIQRLPGVHFNDHSEDEAIWLTVERLHESFAPEPKNPLVAMWIEPLKTPYKEPVLKSSIEQSKLSKTERAGYCDIKTLPSENANTMDTIFLTAEKKSEIEPLFKVYLATEWTPWAAEEKKRRQSIQLYNNLFRVMQQLNGSIVDSEIEFVWGIGIAVWRMNGIKVSHPLITTQADISVNTSTMAIEIRSREVEEQLELDIFNSANNPGTAELEKAYKLFIADKTQGVSPFIPNTFESVIRAAVIALDSNGIYWPEQTTVDDRKLPIASEALKITDT